MYLSIKQRIILAIAVVGGMSIMAIGFLFFQIQNMAYWQGKNLQIRSSNERINQVLISYLGFIQEGYKSEAFLTQNENEQTKAIKAQFEQIFQNKVEESKYNDDLNEVYDSLTKWQINLNQTIFLFRQRGFQDYGLEGEMRKTVHQLENTTNPQEQVYILTLRRHEKDFFMRKQQKYVDKLQKTANEYAEFLKNTIADNDILNHRLSAISAYTQSFNLIVAIESEIGFNFQQGQLAKNQANYNSILPKVSQLSEQISNEVKHARKIVYAAFPIFILLQLMVLLLGFLTISKRVFKPVNLLGTAMQHYSESGEIEESKLYSGGDELGKLGASFKTLIQRQKHIMQEIALKNEELAKNAEEEKARNWIINGLGRVSELMQTSQNIKSATDAVVKFVVHYTNSQLAALYLKNSDDQPTKMILLSTYAYQRHKQQSGEIEIGDGLLGTAWKEGEAIYLTDVPENYITIKSGLGEATPKAVLIAVLKTNDEVLGLMEIAALEPYTEHTLEFLHSAAERIARSLTGALMQEKTTKLLEEANRMANQMQANEEEMRQNLEELQATQEEMHRLRLQEESRIVELEREKEQLEQKLKLLQQPSEN